MKKDDFRSDIAGPIGWCICIFYSNISYAIIKQTQRM